MPVALLANPFTGKAAPKGGKGGSMAKKEGKKGKPKSKARKNPVAAPATRSTKKSGVSAKAKAVREALYRKGVKSGDIKPIGMADLPSRASDIALPAAAGVALAGADAVFGDRLTKMAGFGRQSAVGRAMRGAAVVGLGYLWDQVDRQTVSNGKKGKKGKSKSVPKTITLTRGTLLALMAGTAQLADLGAQGVQYAASKVNEMRGALAGLSGGNGVRGISGLRPELNGLRPELNGLRPEPARLRGLRGNRGLGFLTR